MFIYTAQGFKQFTDTKAIVSNSDSLQKALPSKESLAKWWQREARICSKYSTAGHMAAACFKVADAHFNS